MEMREMSYDPKCQELVEHFLQDEPAELRADEAFVATVAQDLQSIIEDSIALYKQDRAREKQERENPDPR
jgi:hypothetical protein